MCLVSIEHYLQIELQSNQNNTHCSIENENMTKIEILSDEHSQCPII